MYMMHLQPFLLDIYTRKMESSETTRSSPVGCLPLGACWDEWFGDILNLKLDMYKTVGINGKLRSVSGISRASNVV